MINYLGTFNVVPSLPTNLEPLKELAYNLYWTWSKETLELFRRLDRQLWSETNHNPVMMLGKISQSRLEELSKDDGFISHMNRVHVQLKAYKNEKTWHQKRYDKFDKPYIAYFSAEFGLTECLQVYSGGLGVLAGDHLKSSSDLGLPLVGIGLCYKEGYFQQYLNVDGWQQEKYELTDFHNQPMTLVFDEKGVPLKIGLKFPGRMVNFQVWKIEVGRIPLYLLDTNIPENSPEDRRITRSLYGGDDETRIQQEIILGIGGIRTLHALGIAPLVCHMNEGHSAFLALERIKVLKQNHQLSFKEAKEIGFYSNVFTTHTPVPAGIDIFHNHLVEKYFGDYYRKELGLTDKEFYALGTIIKSEEPKSFNMAHLAMNMAGFVNGVSKLHGQVSKKMWVDGFPGIPFNEIPIDYVTNGIHTRSHLSNEMFDLFYRYLGEKFVKNPANTKVWERINEIPDEELWRTHERSRTRLVVFARERLKKQIISRGGSASEIAAAKEVLNTSALTIGFARRFATYKRASLFLRDLERINNILCNSEFPVQIIIAGKAHPRDDEGKKIIQEIIATAKEDHLRKKIVFLENYDMNVAQYMVQGCDVWLNNPRRPLEASGTSGMKTIANGGLNFSVLDGWWDEAYDHDVGWKIGGGEEYADIDYQDEIESRLIYEILEQEIIRMFYNRGDDKLPREWIRMMKNSMIKLGPIYNTSRMVEEYATKFYYPSYESRKNLMEDEWAKGKDFTKWKDKLERNWNKIKFTNISELNENKEVVVGEKYSVSVDVELGELNPDDIEVQIYYGHVDSESLQEGSNSVIMKYIADESGSKTIYRYSGELICLNSGQFGFTIRALPKHSLLINPFELGLIKWA